MIKINADFYLDECYRLRRFDGNEIKNKRKLVKAILKNEYRYSDDGTIIDGNGREYTTRQYIQELRKVVERTTTKEFCDDNKRDFDNLFYNLTLLPVIEQSDTLGHIFRHDRRENFISDWLAYLFNPDKTGTDKLFQSIFELCHISGEFVPTEGIEREKELTYTDDDGRCEKCGRIDFYIETENAIIGIENKIDSDFTSCGQLEKYGKAIKQTAEDERKDPYLFLLYPESNYKIRKKVDLDDVGKKIGINFNIITYEKLIGCWEKIKIDCVKSLRPMIIFEDFIKHVREYVMNENRGLNFNAIKFLSDKSEEIVKLDQIKRGATEQLADYFYNVLQSTIPVKEWSCHVSSGVQYVQCYKSNWKEGIHFELIVKIEKGDCSSFPPKKFALEFHHEGVRDDNLERLSELVKDENKFYTVDYTSEEKFANSVIEMIRNLVAESKKYAERVDEFFGCRLERISDE